MNGLTRPGVILLVCFLLMVVITAIVGERLAVQRDSALSCLVEDNRTGGGSGVRAWAEKIGYSTLPLRAPIQEVERELPQSGHCLITAGNDPWGSLHGEFSDDDWRSLRNWIGLGNTLIVITSDPMLLPKPIDDHFTAADSDKLSDDSKSPAFDQPKRDWFSISKVEYETVPTRWGGEMSVRKNGPRIRNLREEFQFSGHGTAAVLVGKPLDLGMVYVLLDESAWVNEGLDQSDNAATLLRVLKRSMTPTGVLAFDEYRHGFGRIESFTTLFLTVPGAKSFSLMAVVWGLFWLWGNTRRLGPPDEYREIERRTAMEYIESVAALNQRARAAPLAVNSVLQRVRYLLQKRGVMNEAANATLNRAAQQLELEGRPPLPKVEMKLVSEMIQLRKELYGTRQGS